MLKNNIEKDVKVKCVEELITQAELAKKNGTSPSYVNRFLYDICGCKYTTNALIAKITGYYHN